jgi:hypothetical protein
MNVAREAHYLGSKRAGMGVQMVRALVQCLRSQARQPAPSLRHHRLPITKLRRCHISPPLPTRGSIVLRARAAPTERRAKRLRPPLPKTYFTAVHPVDLRCKASPCHLYPLTPAMPVTCALQIFTPSTLLLGGQRQGPLPSTWCSESLPPTASATFIRLPPPSVYHRLLMLQTLLHDVRTCKCVLWSWRLASVVSVCPLLCTAQQSNIVARSCRAAVHRAESIE